MAGDVRLLFSIGSAVSRVSFRLAMMEVSAVVNSIRVCLASLPAAIASSIRC